MFKKFAAFAAVIALAIPAAASAQVGQGNSVKTTFTATATVQPLCSKLTAPNINFGPGIASNSPGVFGSNFPGSQVVNMTNDCTSGSSMEFAFFSNSPGCGSYFNGISTLNGPNGATLNYTIYDYVSNNYVLNCGSPTSNPTNVSAYTQWSNNVNFYAEVAQPSFTQPSGTYTDQVTAVMYF